MVGGRGWGCIRLVVAFWGKLENKKVTETEYNNIPLSIPWYHDNYLRWYHVPCTNKIAISSFHH